MSGNESSCQLGDRYADCLAVTQGSKKRICHLLELEAHPSLRLAVSATRVPFFSDIPLVDRLFRTDSVNNDKSELLIFITPKIIDEQLSLTR